MYKLLGGNRRSPLRLAFPFSTVAVMCFAFLPLTYAVSPAPDGGYGGNNTAEGDGALFGLTSGVWNTADGFQALSNDSTGNVNTAAGFRALFMTTDGGGNTAVGSQALLNNTHGSNNIALGSNSGTNVTTGSSNIDIGNSGTATDSKTIRIGGAGTHTDAYMAGIHGNILPDNGTLQPVFVNNDGKLGTVLSPSSARFKEEIKPMGKVSEGILALKPVTFRYKKELDPKGVAQFGLVAEQVEKINPDLVKRDGEGKLQTVRYEAVNAMLLNEFLKEHRKVENLEATATQQANEIKHLTAAIKEQSAQIQKVSAQLEVNKPVSKLVNNQ